MSTGECVGCLGSRICWVCLGTGYASPEGRKGRCTRCHGTRRCHVCAPATEVAPQIPRRVLVVDDEHDVLDLLRVWLSDDERCGAVETVTSGDAALLALAENCADTIVCDFQLGGTTSADYLPGFRSACPQARILLHTGSPDLALAAGVIERGADLVLEKGRVTLQQLIDEALHD